MLPVLFDEIASIMFYKEYKPSGIIATYIECYWVLQCPADFTSRTELIVPGGRAELMVNMGAPFFFQSSEGKVFEMNNGMHVLGQRNTFFSTCFISNYSVLGIRFKPGCFYTFSNNPVSSLLNEVAAAADVLNYSHIQSWFNQLLEVTNIQQQIEISEQHLLQILKNKKMTDSHFMALLTAMKKSCQTISIQDFCSEHRLYYKKLERQFLQQAGYTPKEFMKISRFYTALKKVCKNKQSLTDVCHSSGYYDQSHFIKDFRKFTSFSPSQFIKEPYQFPSLISSSPFV